MQTKIESLTSERDQLERRMTELRFDLRRAAALRDAERCTAIKAELRSVKDSWEALRRDVAELNAANAAPLPLRRVARVFAVG
jgi:uncharacterized coiled-coil DUF342 family protein